MWFYFFAAKIEGFSEKAKHFVRFSFSHPYGVFVSASKESSSLDKKMSNSSYVSVISGRLDLQCLCPFLYLGTNDSNYSPMGL